LQCLETKWVKQSLKSKKARPPLAKGSRSSAGTKLLELWELRGLPKKEASTGVVSPKELPQPLVVGI